MAVRGRAPITTEMGCKQTRSTCTSARGGQSYAVLCTWQPHGCAGRTAELLWRPPQGLPSAAEAPSLRTCSVVMPAAGGRLQNPRPCCRGPPASPGVQSGRLGSSGGGHTAAPTCRRGRLRRRGAPRSEGCRRSTSGDSIPGPAPSWRCDMKGDFGFTLQAGRRQLLSYSLVAGGRLVPISTAFAEGHAEGLHCCGIVSASLNTQHAGRRCHRMQQLNRHGVSHSLLEAHKA